MTNQKTVESRLTTSPQAKHDRRVIRRPFGLDAAVMPRRTGLQFPDQMPFDAWIRIGNQLHLIGDSTSWWLGDWIIYGENKYPDRYERAVEKSSLDYKTLRNYAWIARRFPIFRRRENLSLAHHSEVAALPAEEQDFWLDRAESGHWSRNRLRREVRTALAAAGLRDEKPAPAPANPAKTPSPAVKSTDAVIVEITLDQGQHQRWQRAAGKINRDLEDWIKWLADKEAVGEEAFR
jgi:hypothetical protein